MRRVAILDIGSNSVQLLVADVIGRGWTQVACAEQVTRLAEGLTPGGPFDARARERTLAAVVLLASRARALGASDAWATGTRAFRVAADADDLAARVQAAAGVAVEIITAEREAGLGFEGAAHALGTDAGWVLGLDVGGASTEIVCAQDGCILDRVSLPVGAVVTTEACLHHDPPQHKEMTALREAVARAVEQATSIDMYVKLGGEQGRAIAAGGTATTAAAMVARLDVYRAELVHGRRITRGDLHDLIAAIAARTVKERRRMPGLDAARAASILGGMAVLEAVLEAARAVEVTVSDRGLRHALLRERVRELAAARHTSTTASR